MTQAERSDRRSFEKSRAVTLRSRNGQTVQVEDDLDRAFLELADAFMIESEKIKNDPRRRRPRLGPR